MSPCDWEPIPPPTWRNGPASALPIKFASIIRRGVALALRAANLIAGAVVVDAGAGAA